MFTAKISSTKIYSHYSPVYQCIKSMFRGLRMAIYIYKSMPLRTEITALIEKN